jgi:hypothetical protein
MNEETQQTMEEIMSEALKDPEIVEIRVRAIARVAYEANRGYCQALGDDSFLPWEEAPAWQQDTCIEGVRFHMEHPGAGPEAFHESWLEQKRREGWKYGPVKNPETKEHPCMVAYHDLPTEQKAKDYIFRGVVRALLGETCQGQ